MIDCRIWDHMDKMSMNAALLCWKIQGIIGNGSSQMEPDFDILPSILYPILFPKSQWRYIMNLRTDTLCFLSEDGSTPARVAIR